MSGLNNLLIYRFVIVNLMLIAVVGALTWAGFLVPVYQQDLSYLTYAISGLFATGWCATLYQFTRLSRQLNDGWRKCPMHPEGAEKANIKTEWLHSLSEWMVGLGLLGTVIGFSIALSGVDRASLADAHGAQEAVATLMTGMRIALNTTLMGAALSIWHQINMRMFDTANRCYWLDRVTAWKSGR